MEGTKHCPFCSEEIKVEALICRHCDFDLRTGKPVVREQPSAAPTEEDAPLVEPRSIPRRPLGLPGRVAIASGVVFVGLLVVVPWLADSGQDVPSGCVKQVELHSASRWASDLDRPESWVAMNHRIRLWSQSSRTGNKGRAVGEMRPGERAVVIEDDGTDYLVKSPLDGSVGWISRVQVARESCR